MFLLIKSARKIVKVSLKFFDWTLSESGAVKQWLSFRMRLLIVNRCAQCAKRPIIQLSHIKR